MEALQAEMSVAGRMVRVFYALSQTFEAVADRRAVAGVAAVALTFIVLNAFIAHVLFR